MMNKNYLRAIAAVLAGMALNFLGDWALGARIDIFVGIGTFTFPWMLDVFLVPFITGMAVAKIYGAKGGKWLACLPAALLRALPYLRLHVPVRLQ